MRLLDAEGRERLRVDSSRSGPRKLRADELQDKSHRDYFLAAKQVGPGHVAVSEMDLNVEHGMVQTDCPVVRFSTPVWPDNHFFGVIVINYDPAAIMRHLDPDAPLGDLFLATLDGNYMYHSDHRKRWSKQLGTNEGLYIDWPDLKQHAEKMRLVAGGDDAQRVRAGDDQHELALTTIALGNSDFWVLGMHIDTNLLFARSRDVFMSAMQISAVIAGLAMLVAALLSITWARPIRRLAVMANRVRQGDYNVRVPGIRRDEIGVLERAFNELASEVEATVVLQQERRAAEAASIAKSAFLARMSHELRTPLTAIIGYGDLLHKALRHRPELCDDVRAIRTNSRHLLNLISDILDLSKIEAGKMEMEITECSPLKIVSETVAITQIVAKEKGLDVRVDFRSAIPEHIYTDPTRLRQVLVNLMGNAVKFTLKGSILIAVEQVARDDAQHLQFTIEDSGIGIPQDRLESVFEAFSQADSATTREYGGTGLGLSISKEIIAALGGTIQVSSQLGVGTKFEFTIDPGPLEGVPAISDPMEAFQNTAKATLGGALPKLKGTILLVEDTPVNRRLIRTMLTDLGIEVETATNGQEAVNAVTKHPPDLILMDMQMPVMDGITATRELRQRDIATPIVFLTANAMRSDREACLDAGGDGFVTKPIDIKQLHAELAIYLPVSDEAAGFAESNLALQTALLPNEPTNNVEKDSPVDANAAMERLHVDLTTYLEAMEETLPWLGQQLTALREFGETADAEGLGDIAHAIKSAAGSLGMRAVHVAAQAVEMTAKGHDEGDLRKLSQELMRNIESTADYLNNWMPQARRDGSDPDATNTNAAAPAKVEQDGQPDSL